MDKKLAILLILFLTAFQTPSAIPVWIDIPAIGLSSPVVPVIWEQWIDREGRYWGRYPVDPSRVGWHNLSAPLGQPGNTVLNGHGSLAPVRVFEYLYLLQPGDKIVLTGSDGATYIYYVTSTLVVKEKGESLEKRIENSKLILPTADERITLVTCWPDDRYRLIVTAKP